MIRKTREITKIRENAESNDYVRFQVNKYESLIKLNKRLKFGVKLIFFLKR